MSEREIEKNILGMKKKLEGKIDINLAEEKILGVARFAHLFGFRCIVYMQQHKYTDNR